MNSNAGPFKHIGEQLFAIREAAMIEDSGGGRRIDERLLQVQERALPAGGSETVPADGGFLLQPDFSETIANKVYNYSYLLSRVTKLSTGSNGLKLIGFDETSRVAGSRWGGVRAYWENEANTADSTTKPKYRQIELTMKKLIAIGYVTSELLQDAVSLGQAMEQAFVGEMGTKIDGAILKGTGAGQPLGFIDPGNNGLIQVPIVAGQAAGSIIDKNVRDIYARMWGPSRLRSAWFMHQDLEAALIDVAVSVGSAGSAVPWFTFALADDQPNRLLGRPIFPHEHSPTPGTLGDILFVDPSQYLFCDRLGLQTALSMHVKFSTDEQAFRYIWRCDGQPLWHAPITPIAGTNTLSASVALAAR